MANHTRVPSNRDAQPRAASYIAVTGSLGRGYFPTYTQMTDHGFYPVGLEIWEGGKKRGLDRQA